MEMLKGRTIKKGQRVFVYKNLHKDCWSVKDVKTGLVLAHTQEIELTDCEFKVSEAGRQRVLNEKRKNVHAGIIGHYSGDTFSLEDIMKGMQTVSYNPYMAGHFRVRILGTKITKSEVVRMTNKNVFAKM